MAKNPAWLFSTLLSKGLLPRELPPTFSSRSLGECAMRHRNKVIPPDVMKGGKWASYEVYNLARAGTLRRELAIVNPVAYWHVARLISSKWSILSKASSRSEISLTKPILDEHRALARSRDIASLPYTRATTRAYGKFCLYADISNFYSSIYTHTIAWALHGKKLSRLRIKIKDKKKKKLLGQELDDAIRCMQDGRSVGIPVGPDISLLVAEIILGAVDSEVSSNAKHGLRYVDDYELIFETEEDAIAARSALQNALATYRLALNPLKTRIARFPRAIDDKWTRELAKILPRKRPLSRSLAINFFDAAFRISELSPGEGVLKYAIGKLARIEFSQDASALIDDLLLHCVRVEAGCLPFAMAILLRNRQLVSGRAEKLQLLFESTIREHAPQHHSSEVAWSLWACLSFQLQLSSKIIDPIVGMEDSVCALLLIQLHQNKLIDCSAFVDELKRSLNTEELYGGRWMLAYEMVRMGIIPRKSPSDYVKMDRSFNFLLDQGVSFFDGRRVGAVPSGLLPNPSVEEEEDNEDEDIDEEEEHRFNRYSEGDFWDEWDDFDEEWEADQKPKKAPHDPQTNESMLKMIELMKISSPLPIVEPAISSRIEVGHLASKDTKKDEE